MRAPKIRRTLSLILFAKRIGGYGVNFVMMFLQKSVIIFFALLICCGMGAVIPSNDLFTGIRSFSSEFYNQCATSKSGNVIISPLSVATALGLLSQAANGNTFDEIQRGLHLKIAKNAIADSYYNFHDVLRESGGNATFDMANHLYVQKGYQIKNDFRTVAKTKFYSGVENMDFNAADDAANSINSLVEEETGHEIKDLISSKSFGPDTRLVLVNAAHFKGRWEIPFEIVNTSPGLFYTSANDSANVEYMNIKDYFKFAFLDYMDAVAIEMRYAESEFSFIGVLPNSRTGISALELMLKNYNLAELINRMEGEDVDVKIPKFKIEYEIQLNATLKSMGMNDMFSDKANLGEMVIPTKPLKISEAKHKAFIQIDEHGTGAPPSTVFQFPLTSFRVYDRPPVFHADHPFVFFIWDRVTETILFYGRCTKFE